MLTLVVPVRDWPQERAEYAIRSFRALGTKLLSEVIVVDFGSAQPVLPFPAALDVRLIRVEADRWSAGEAVNVGVAIAVNDVIAKIDSDILIGRSSRIEFEATVRAIAAGQIGLAMSQCTDLPPGMSAADAYAAVVERGDSPGRLRAKWGQGGLVYFARGAWDRIGGLESRFTGWGNEDNDFPERVRQAGYRIRWTDRSRLSIFHVWHPPTYAATGVLKQRQKNSKLATTDKSVFRPMVFRHSNFASVAAPAVLRRISPLVTLAIATTARPNRERMISEAINSFKGQIDNDFEVLVVDNGSPSEESDKLKRRLQRIKWTDRMAVEVRPVGSIPAARNAISAAARGRYICVVDDDDLALPNRLEDHLKVFTKDGNLHGSHGGWIDFDESTGVIERNQGKQRTIATLLKGTGKVTAHPASLYRADVMRAVPYDESFALGSDFDMALRMANNGFEIAHTNSYLTLRRYHSANVTITGQSNQVSNGAAARSRTLASFEWQRLGGLEDEAKANNDEVYCRNQMSIDSIADLIPGYTGTWQVFVPISVLTTAPAANGLMSGASHGDDLAINGFGGKLAYGGVNGFVVSNDTTATSGLLARLIDIVPGDLCTRQSGVNETIYFRSAELAELKRARKVKEAVENLVGLPVQLNSARQAQIDREVPFAWSALPVKAGERILQSERFDDLADLLNKLNALGDGSLLRSTLSVLSDYDEDGEAYYLVSASIKGHDNLRQLEFDLERGIKVPFRHIASHGVVSELTPRTRSH